ncbi:CSS-motif domain-containing protein [Pseudomonas sp.]|uniref:CSS-motif domain-containing protein n=1 Tax=Pseudomonas sp. TaxID=306 RepID=UPI0028ADE815|nr:CSS-motif domain-containing protein [Pseudomonas sp.]
MTTLRQPRHSFRSLLLIVGICLIPIFCGTLVIVQQIDRALDVAARAAGQRALYVVDRVFDAVRETSNMAMHISLQDCSGVSTQLATRVKANPMLQALGLQRGNGTICVSSQTDRPTTAMFERLGDQRITLNTPTPDNALDSLLTFAWHADDHTLLATVKGRQLHSQLSQFTNGEILQLDFVDHSIWITQNGFEQSNANLTLNRASKLSTQYDYTVHVGYGPDTFRRMFWRYALNALPWLILVGLVTGIGAHLLRARNGRKATHLPS